MIIAPFFMVLLAATAIAHFAPGNQAPFFMAHSAPGNQTLPESNVLPPDKHFPKVWIQEVVRRECPKAGDIPELHLPDKREYSVQTYVDKYNEVMGRRCDKNPQHRLHRRAFKTKVEATTYLGKSFNIGDAQYMLKRDQQGGRSIIDRSPLPEACYTNMGGSLYTSYATFADSASEYSDEMAASANVEVGYGAFGASVNATAGNMETLSKDVLYYRYDGLYITEVVAFNSLCLREFLNPELKNDLLAIEHQDLPMDDATHPGYLPYIRLLEKWGTHYVTTQYSGGSYELTMTSDKVHFSDSTDFAASVRANILMKQVGGSKEESEKLDSAKSTLRVAVSGGRREAVNNLTNAFRKGDSDAMDEATGQWLKSVAHGAKGPQELHYEPVFRDVIPHVYVDDYVRQAAFLENLKQVERIVSRRAWKNYCVPAMWDEERLTCEVDKPVAIIGIWVHLYQANRHCFYYKDNQIQVLKNRTGSGCSAFRYTERGTIEVDGEEGILMFESGNTHKATISKAVGFPDHYAKFRFTGLCRIVSVERGAASADPISLYVDGGVLHLGPRPLNLKEEMYRFSAVPIADQSKPAPPVPSVPVQKKILFADQSKPVLSFPSVPFPQLTIFTWTQTNSKEVWLKNPFLAAYHEDEKRARYVGMVINTSPEHGQMAAGIVGEIADDGILYASSTSIPYGGSYYPLREERYAVLSCNNPEAVKWLQVHGKASEATIPKGYELFVADRTSYDVDIYVARNLISHDVGWSSSAMEEMEFCVNNPNCEVESRVTSDYEVMIVKLPYKTFEM